MLLTESTIKFKQGKWMQTLRLYISMHIFVSTIALVLLLAGCSPNSPQQPAPPQPTDADGFRLMALGTAQDGGFPHAACGCVRCAAALDDPGLARNVASVAILSPTTGKQYLVDAGPDIRLQLNMLAQVAGTPPPNVDRSPVDGVFLTHAHLGHYTGLAFFGFEAVHTTDLPVWCTEPMASLLRANAPWSQLVRIGNIDLREIRPGEAVEPEAGLKIKAIAVPHRDEYADTVAFLIESSRKTILYAPDTDSWDRWDPPLPSVLATVDIAILDGTFFSPDELPGRRVEEIGHPLITSTMDLLQPLVDSAKVEVWFTHMNHSNPVLGPDPHAANQVRSRGFHILEDGQDFLF
jgi:pyrroloquinoline quinone biosynthesis protein B